MSQVPRNLVIAVHGKSYTTTNISKNIDLSQKYLKQSNRVLKNYQMILI